MDGISLSNALNSRMKYLADRQAVLSGNIANADTPGYLPRDVLFKGYLDKASGKKLGMAATSKNHLNGSASSDGSGSSVVSAVYVQHNGNGVRLDEQLMKMNATELEYREMIQMKAKLAGFQKIAIGRQP